MFATSDWIINYGTVILAAAAIVSAWISVVSLRSSKNVLEAARTQAAATEHLARTTSSQFEASSLPLLADVSQHHVTEKDVFAHDYAVVIEGTNDGKLTLTIPIRNVGPGLAFIKRASLNVIAGDGVGLYAITSQRVIPSGETALIMSNSDVESGPVQQSLRSLIANQFCASIDYTDFSESRQRRTVIYVTRSANYWFIRGVDVHECDENWNIVGSPVVQDWG